MPSFFRATIGTVNMRTLRSRISGLAWDLTHVTGSFSRKSQKFSQTPTFRDWWLSGKVAESEIALMGGLSGQANSVIEIRDTEPLIDYYLLSHELSVAQKLMLRRGPVQFKCHATKSGHSIRLDPLTVNSGIIQVAGGIRWLESSHYPEGSLALNLGPIAVGTRFADGKSEFRLFPTDQWLKSRLRQSDYEPN